MDKDIIESAGKRLPYKVPDGYLEDFTGNMMQHYGRIKREKMRRRYFSIARVAALFLLFLIPGIIFLTDGNSVKNNTDFVGQDSVVISAGENVTEVDNSISSSITNLSDEELLILTSVLDSDIYKDQL